MGQSRSLYLFSSLAHDSRSYSVLRWGAQSKSHKSTKTQSLIERVNVAREPKMGSEKWIVFGEKKMKRVQRGEGVVVGVLSLTWWNVASTPRRRRRSKEPYHRHKFTLIFRWYGGPVPTCIKARSMIIDYNSRVIIYYPVANLIKLLWA